MILNITHPGKGPLPKSFSKKLIKQLPRRDLTNVNLCKFVKGGVVLYFRDMFMRDPMSDRGLHYSERTIKNLDDKDGPGTHWVAYKKQGNNIQYFDSFADLQHPTELIRYLKKGRSADGGQECQN